MKVHILTVLLLILLRKEVEATRLRGEAKKILRRKTQTVLGSGYIQVILLENDLPSRQSEIEATFKAASVRWGDIITSELPDINFQSSVNVNQATFCGQVDHTFQPGDFIDDLVIFANIVNIDGPGGTLGSAGPCNFVQVDGIFFPRLGVMTFDSADTENLLDSGSFSQVIEHEMGHVLGIGSIWDDLVVDLNEGGVIPNFEYTGSNGISGYEELGGDGNVPVENMGGPGTAGGHWRESTFANELMTGFLSPNPNPISIMTIRSLIDLGYGVNESKAEPYQIPGTPLPPGNITMVNCTEPVTPGGMMMDEDGTLVNFPPNNGAGALLRQKSIIFTTSLITLFSFIAS